MPDEDRLDVIVRNLNSGASIHAIADKLGITYQSVQYHIRKALRLGRLIRIDGRGRHKRPVYRIPGGALESLSAPQGHAEQPVADVSLPPTKPGPEWRHIEWAEFRWHVRLDHPELITWDRRSEGMKNGVRWREWRRPYLGQIWGTVQLYSGTFTAVLHMDKIPVRWSDSARWNDIMFSLAVDAQAKLARDLADLGTGVSQTIPEPIENDKNRAARIRGEPYLITGELVIPVSGAGNAPRQFVNATTEYNRTPPGPAVETGSIPYGWVADHLPERVMSLEAANGRTQAVLERVEAAIQALLDQTTKLTEAQERTAKALEALAGAKKPEPQAPQEPTKENPDNWRMFG